MTITLNGKSTNSYPEPISVSTLLEKLRLAGKPVLVELDGLALRPRDFEESMIADGAVVELIQVAAGG